MAMPTPKSTPARIRFDPPSPNANVSPATTMATSERPRAIVLVKACCRTFTAFSHGEFPACEKAGDASRRLTATTPRVLALCLNRPSFRQSVFILFSLIQPLRVCEEMRRVLAVFVAGAPGGNRRKQEPLACEECLDLSQDTHRARAPCRGFLALRPARDLRAARYARR